MRLVVAGAVAGGPPHPQRAGARPELSPALLGAERADTCAAGHGGRERRLFVARAVGGGSGPRPRPLALPQRVADEAPAGVPAPRHRREVHQVGRGQFFICTRAPFRCCRFAHVFVRGRSQDSGTGTPVTLRVDPKGFFLYWIDQNHEVDLLDIATIRDARTGCYAKIPKVLRLSFVSGRFVQLEICTICKGQSFCDY